MVRDRNLEPKDFQKLRVIKSKRLQELITPSDYKTLSSTVLLLNISASISLFNLFIEISMINYFCDLNKYLNKTSYRCCKTTQVTWDLASMRVLSV